MNNSVQLTKSGIIARADKGFGTIIFSPYTGLFFACPLVDYATIISWLNKDQKIKNQVYRQSIGPGWDVAFEHAEYPPTHFLPDPNDWSIPKLSYPIVINWLLTGNCSLKCKYCYAEDLMRGKCNEPSKDEVTSICKKILSFKPVAVVLTGGDPLLSPHLENALRLLYGKAGIIIDTNGVGLNSVLIKLLRRFNVHVRISFDSEIPKVNNFLRPFSKQKSSKSENSAEFALNAICNLVDSKLAVSVQTVATNRNRSDLEQFGDKLYRIGVRAWRILLVAPSAANIQNYKMLVGTESGQARFHKYIERQLLIRHENGWNKVMGVQITHNRAPNSVILVSPDGTFMTESRVVPKKVIIDKSNPKKPRVSSLMQMVDMHAHVERYLCA